MSKFKIQMKFKIQTTKSTLPLFICHCFDIWILTFEIFWPLASCDRREDTQNVPLL
jgi:hypothetical protein